MRRHCETNLRENVFRVASRRELLWTLFLVIRWLFRVCFTNYRVLAFFCSKSSVLAVITRMRVAMWFLRVLGFVVLRCMPLVQQRRLDTFLFLLKQWNDDQLVQCHVCQLWRWEVPRDPSVSCVPAFSISGVITSALCPLSLSQLQFPVSRCCSQTLPAAVLTSLTPVMGSEPRLSSPLANFSFQVLLSNSASCHHLTPVPLASPAGSVYCSIGLFSLMRWHL